MKTSSGEALGHPKPLSPPSPALRGGYADSSEAPPGWGGGKGEESGEVPPRRGVGRRRPEPRGPGARLGPGSPRRGCILTCSGGVALPGRPAQREQQPERPERGRAHGARLDGAAAAAAAAVCSAQQVTSLSERRKELGAGREEGKGGGEGVRRGERELGSKGHPLSYNLHNFLPTCRPTHPPTHPPTSQGCSSSASRARGQK